MRATIVESAASTIDALGEIGDSHAMIDDTPLCPNSATARWHSLQAMRDGARTRSGSAF